MVQYQITVLKNYYQQCECMNLLKIKARFVSGMSDTTWLELSRGVTLFVGDKVMIERLFATIESVNPIYATMAEYPLAHESLSLARGNYQKKVLPEKSTAGYLIFSGDSRLVPLLGDIDPLFFEVDRIEIGRRLDRSRWLSFVEIRQSSGRWSEISGRVGQLIEQLKGEGESYKELPLYQPTERLRGFCAEEVETWLSEVRQCLPRDGRYLCDECLAVVRRRQRFLDASVVTYAHLPLLLGVSFDNDEGVGCLSAVKRYVDNMVQLLLDRMSDAEFARRYHEHHEILAKEMNLPSGIGLEWKGGSFVGCRGATGCTRIAYLGTLCILGMLLQDNYPVLLLRGIEENLGGRDKEIVRQYMIGLGSVTQILYAEHLEGASNYDDFDVRYKVSRVSQGMVGECVRF